MVCCLTGIWMQHYIIIRATLAPDFEILGHVWSGNDTIAWWFRLTSNSDRPYPYKTCTMCLGIGMLSQGHIGTSLYRSTSQVDPRFWSFFITCGVELMQLHHGWGSHPPQTASHIHPRHIKSVWAIGMLSHRHMGAPLYRYTGQFGLRFWVFCHLWSGNDAITSWLRLISTSDASHIHIRHIQSVWGIGMLSHRHMGAPLYHYRGWLAPDFGILGHLWSGNDAISSWFRLTSTSDCFPNPY